MIDSHSHLWFDQFDEDRDSVIERARAAGVDHFVVVGTDLVTSSASGALAGERDDCSATAGIHPCDVTGLTEGDWKQLDEMLASGAFCGVGETGLDHYWDHSTPRDQRVALARHFDLARRHDLPVVIHCRDAWPDLLDALAADGAGTRGIMHCFSGGVHEMERSLELGYDVSFAGPVTYPRSEALREALARCPADRFHIETDCPFLPPQGRRGQRNEPAFMSLMLERMAEVRGCTAVEIATTTANNTRRMFAL